MRRITPLLMVLVPLLSVAGCEVGTGGESGALNFSDRTTIPDNELFGDGWHDGRIAVGSELTLRVTRANKDVELLSATTEDSAVFDVVGTETSNVILKALAEGETRVSVTTASGQDDSILLDAVTPAKTTLRLYPWTEVHPLPESLWAEGAAILPQTYLTLFADVQDADGVTLSGYQPNAWVVTSGQADASVTQESRSNMAVFGSGTEKGPFELRFTDEQSLTIQSVTEEEVVDIDLVVVHDDSQGGGVDHQLHVGSTMLLHTVLRTAEGLYVIGAGTQSAEVSLGEGADAKATLEHALLENPEGEEENAIQRALRVGRAAIVTANTEGELVLKTTWGALTKEVTFQVVPKPAP